MLFFFFFLVFLKLGSKHARHTFTRFHSIFLLRLSPIFFRFEFPNAINLENFCAPGVYQEQDYKLFSVVVHRGEAGGGHYLAYNLDVYGEGSKTGPVVSIENYFKLYPGLVLYAVSVVTERGISLPDLHKTLMVLLKDLPSVCVCVLL